MASCNLTTENAHEYVGKYLIGKLWHCWPLKVKQLDDGRYAVVDSIHTMMLVPDKKDKFNAIYFDKAFSNKEEAESALNSSEKTNG